MDPSPIAFRVTYDVIPGRSARTGPEISRFRVRALRAPERQSTFHSQPPFAPLEALQVLETLALVAGAAEIEFLDVLIVAEFGGRAVEHHLALLHDIPMACN